MYVGERRIPLASDPVANLAEIGQEISSMEELIRQGGGLCHIQTHHPLRDEFRGAVTLQGLRVCTEEPPSFQLAHLAMDYLSLARPTLEHCLRLWAFLGSSTLESTRDDRLVFLMENERGDLALRGFMIEIRGGRKRLVSVPQAGPWTRNVFFVGIW